MKKLFLFCTALVCAVFTASALNPFAYGLSSELSEDGSSLTVYYTLNADATAAYVVVYDDETEVGSFPITDITAGEHSAVIVTATLPSNRSLTWGIKTMGTSPEAKTAVKCDTQYNFYHPQGLDIDMNPESEHFGRILITECMEAVATKTNYHASGKGAGLYAFNPDMTPVAEGVAYRGGHTYSADKDMYGANNRYAPRKVRIAEDGRIFLTTQDDKGTILFEVNPDNLDEWTKVITGTQNDVGELYNGDDFVAAMNVSMDVTGAGNDLKIMLLSANKSGLGFAYSGYRLDEYNLGTATSWNAAPSKAIAGLSGKYTISPTNTNVIYDGNGGIWYANSRSAATEKEPQLVHLNAEGVEDFSIKTAGIYYGGAGIRFNRDGSILAIGRDRINASNGQVGIHTVSADEEGKPVLTKEYDITLTGIGRNINDIAFDVANNMYVCGNSGEKFQAYALPYSGETVVPAAGKYAFTLNGTGTYIDNTAADAIITKKIVRNGQVLILVGDKTYNVMGQVVE